jgi:protein TonB
MGDDPMKLFAISLCYLLSQFVSYHPQRNTAQQDQTATQATSVPRITVKADVMKKKLVHKVTPLYPKEARNQHIAGTLKLHVVIGVDGSVKQVEYVSGPEVFLKPTIEAVRQNKYKPTTENGQPVEVDTTVETVFSLIE